MRCVVAVAALAVLLGPGPAVAFDPPKSLRDAIAALGDMRLARGKDIDRDACRHYAAPPWIAVSGDFDGDGRVDWALYVVSARPSGRIVDRGKTTEAYDFRFVFARARPGDRYELVTAREAHTVLPLPHYLAVHPPGVVREVDGGSGARVVLSHRGVTELYCGQAASTYFWDTAQRTFRSIVTGD